MEENKATKIGEILVRDRVISYVQLSEALDLQRATGKKLGEILLEKSFITEAQLMDALADLYQLTIVNLDTMSVQERVIKIFSYKLLIERNVAPLKIENENLLVAINDPLDLATIQTLQNISGFKVKIMLSSSSGIKTYLDKYFSPPASSQVVVKELIIAKDKHGVGEKDPSIKELGEAAQEAPTVSFVNSIIGEAIKQKASDIHFEPCKSDMRIRFRIDGMLYEKAVVPHEMVLAVTSRIKIISGMDIAERRKPQDGRVSVSSGAQEYDIRASTLPDIFGEKIVLRLLDKKSIILTLEFLGMSSEDSAMLLALIKRPYGMILLSGPTGSGKSTTLYSILNILNSQTKNIVTVEDPVEYELDGINQTAINVKAGYTFATAIRHILRQDPNVIMIGEIRDVETAEIAIQAALTGHLVFSTIHTNSAPGVITRLIDMNVEPFLVSSSIIGVMAQRLVRRLCPICKEVYPVTEEMKRFIPELAAAKITEIARPVGCDTCFHTGYAGRVAIFEILIMQDDVRRLALHKSAETDIAAAAKKQGMRSLRGSGMQKVFEKITSLEEVMRSTFEEKA